KSVIIKLYEESTARENPHRPLGKITTLGPGHDNCYSLDLESSKVHALNDQSQPVAPSGPSRTFKRLSWSLISRSKLPHLMMGTYEFLKTGFKRLICLTVVCDFKQVGEMAQLLRTLTALLEDLSWAPSTQARNQVDVIKRELYEDSHEIQDDAKSPYILPTLQQGVGDLSPQNQSPLHAHDSRSLPHPKNAKKAEA
ncbi:hypothetical protein STEG23_015828, partial [Scotinomys teguina]